MNVAFTYRSSETLTISWTAPPRNSWNGQRLTYQVCSSYNARSSNPTCSSENIQSSTAVIKNLRPATKYFVTVAAGTSAGYGPKSTEISKITNEGKHAANLHFSEKPENNWRLYNQTISPNHRLFSPINILFTQLNATLYFLNRKKRIIKYMSCLCWNTKHKVVYALGNLLAC